MSDNGFISQIQNIIRKKTPDHSFGASQLAESLSLSRSQLNRKLHFQTGHSPGQLILFYRMEVARRLLSETSRSIKEISWQCGFSSTSSFCRKFKKLFGLNPTDYQRIPETKTIHAANQWSLPVNEVCYAGLIVSMQRFHWLGLMINLFIKNIESKNMEVSEIARALCMSPSHLNRKTHRLFGIPVTQFIRDLKLQYAFELLLEKKHSIAQVAVMSGFFDSAHLNRHFRQAFGVSPGKADSCRCTIRVIADLKKLVLQQTGN